ncbi:desmoplakin-like isoform X3 [Plectropomus leopardus]|uniref:desmoplakin-like isoform X3 n=1 Tax=Plectropomus leopardus TaxID=160734 RepID=UPI001C4C65E0|nr:desmoplakin-like isoform X3 [Plectropomus leopardus]
MSQFGSQRGLNLQGRSMSSRGDLTGEGGYYAHSEVLHGGGNGYEPYLDGYTYTFSKSSGGMAGGMSGGTMTGMSGGTMTGMSGGTMTGMVGLPVNQMSGMSGVTMSRMAGGMTSEMMIGGGMTGGTLSSMKGGKGGGMSAAISIHQRALTLQHQCQEYLKTAENALKSGASGDAERFMLKARETIEQLKICAMDLRQMGQPSDNVIRTVEVCNDHLKDVHFAMTGSIHRRRSTRGSSGGWEEPGRSFEDAIAWIAQQKRLIETAPWGDDPAAIDQQLINHQKFNISIQKSTEVDRAKDDLEKKGDKGNLHALAQEWDSLQNMSKNRFDQLQDLKSIIQEISKAIMWVNDKEEEELMFDWGDKNIDQYIPKKQESYSKLMSALEDKEKELNKLKAKADTLLKDNHPAADKIEAYKDTLQTQWSWLLQITKCIDTHLKENAAYSQFFREANETYSTLQKEHELVRTKFTCDKNTPLENLLEILGSLEREKERIMDNKRQVQHLAIQSKNIVRLKPRNPEEKCSSPVIVKALCDFKQDQKVICKGNEAILKDNSQRSKWDVTGPGGLDMTVPSVCLIVPPPNPLGISLANKNEQYYEAILSIWNQLYINIKSLIAWQYCLSDIRTIKSLTIEMLSTMRPEDYHKLIKSLESHYEEFILASSGSQMFVDEDKRAIENQFNGAQNHFEQLVVQLPTYNAQLEQIEKQKAAEQQYQHQLIIIQQQNAAEAEARRLKEEAIRREEEARRLKEEEARRLKEEEARIREEKCHIEGQIKKKKVKVTSHSLSELHALRLRLEGAEGTLSQHVHICLGDDGMNDCGLKITQLEMVQHDVESMREEFSRLEERILKELAGITDADKAKFLRNELRVINERLSSLDSSSSAYLQRLQALREMLESVAQAEDIVKVHEARLTEKETTSLSPSEVEDYITTLQNIKAELDQKKDVLASMEAELGKASYWNSQVGGPSHRCDMMLSKYTELVSLLSDRWRRILGQIDTRILDLETYQPKLEHYKQTSTSLIDWIDTTEKKQDLLQATKIDSIPALTEHINDQKGLNTEIKMKRETVDSVLKDNEACVNSVKDYEMDLASYTSGLETLLNIPFKRPMLKSPSMDLNLEATQLQTRYMELLTHSDDYYKFLGTLLKNMEEIKIRNTRIDLLEEELRLLREDMQGRDAKNKSLEEAISRYQLDLSLSHEKLVSMEEMSTCNATKDILDTTQSQLADLKDEVAHLKCLLEEEKRKRRLAEERYTMQQEEYELVLSKRQKELETVSWSKVDLEKSGSSKDHEIEQLRRQLAEEAARIKELQKEMSKVRSQCSTEINNLKLSYESQIQISHTDMQRLAAQKDEDTADLQQQYDRMEAERRNLEEELRRLRMSMSHVEEQRKRAEEESRSQRSVITEEGRRRRELESQLELLMRQRDEESSQYMEELAEAMKALQEKNEELAYITHSLEEETRRRKTTEEGQGVLEQTVTQLQVKLTSSAMAETQLGEREEELRKMRSELERENRERSRVEQNMSRLQGRVKDLQEVRDGLESQVENLRKANQEEVLRRRQAETELENTAKAMTEYVSTITTLRQNQEHASTAEKRGEEERLRLQEELEKSLRQNKNSAERMTQLSAELKAMQQQLLQEQARAKEANLRNESLYRTIEEKSMELNKNCVQVQKLKEMTETQTKERLRLEEELKTTKHDKEELLRAKQGINDELFSQITALEMQLQTSERSNVDYRNLVSELSSEREKLKLETEKIQTQATETTAMMQSIQSQHNEIVNERDALLLKLQLSEKDKDRYQRLEEELSRIKLSLDSEVRNKQRLQEENERGKRDVNYWKDQCNSKQDLIKQYDADKERLERERNSLKSEIDRLMRELRELDDTFKSRLSSMQKEMREMTVVKQSMETELKKNREPATLDASTVVFDGVRKPVTANQLLECGVLDKPTVSQLVKGHKTVPDVSVDKKVCLKGTGPIAGVVIEGPKGPGSIAGPQYKMTFTEVKKENLLPPDSIDLLLDAQAATGHIIDPRTNQKLTVEEACDQGVVDEEDRERLLAAEAAAVGYYDPGTSKPLSVFQAMKKGLIDKNTTLRLLQAQESVGGILDPILSVFLPKNTAIERNLINDDIYRALNQRPELYLDPETEEGVTYMSMKGRCKVDPLTGLLLFPILERVDPSKLVFEGVRKPVTAKQLLDCGVLEKPTYKDLEKGKKNVPEVSVDKNVNLKGTGPIAGVIVGSQGKMSFSEAKKRMLLPEDCADLLLEAQAATGHIIDPRTNQKLTVEEACARGIVDVRDRDRLLAAEAAAVGYKDSSTAKPLSVFEAMKKELIDRRTGLRLLQAQECVGGILDPNLSVFLPTDTAIKRNLLDENLRRALILNPECYIDPETECDASYGKLKKRCKTEPHTGLLLLPITERLDPSKLIFNGVRKPVTAQQLLDCGVLDNSTFSQLIKGEKTVPEVSEDKKVFLKGTGSIAGVAAGPLGKMSLLEAKKQMLMPPVSADLLLDAQAATGHIIDITTNEKLTVEEACARRVVDIRDRDRLLAAEAAAVGYRDPSTAKPLSVFEAMKKGLINRNTGLRLLQAQESAGGILDPNLSVFLPRDTAKKRNLLDEDLSHALNQSPACYIDPDTDHGISYGALKKRSKTESHTGLILLPITERKDPSKLMFDGIRKQVSAQQLFECGILDKPTFDQLVKGEKTIPAVSLEKTVYLKGTGPIAGVVAGREGKMSFSEAKNQMLMLPASADLLLEAQAATGYIIDPRTDQKLTVEEACARGLMDIRDRDRLLAAEAAAVGYKDPSTAKPLSVFEAIKKGIIDSKTGLRLLQAQESVGGILDPNLSVFLPKDTAKKRNLLDEDLSHALNQSPACYIDPETEYDTSYGALKRRSKTESHTGLILLPITERKDPSKLMFDGIRKKVSAQQMFECGVLDKPTFDQLVKGEKTVSEVSVEKMVFLKGTGPIAGVLTGHHGKMSLFEAKKKMILPPDSADLLLEAQAATGHIIDPKTNQKLTVEEACARGVVDIRDQERLLVAEAAAVGYKDPSAARPLSVFEAMNKGIIDSKTGLRLLQAQESVGGILDPNLSVFLPKDAAIKRKLLDENLRQILMRGPACYLDPETEHGASYGALKERCKTEPQASLQLLPVSEKFDPSKLLFDAVRKTVTAQQLLDCGVLDKPTFNQLIKGEKTVLEVSVDKKVFLKGTGSISGVAAGPLGKMSFTDAKKQKIMPADCADMLLYAQAATGNIIDPKTNQRLTVKDACARGVVDKEDVSKLFAAESASIGYRDPHTGKLLSAGQAMKKGLIDKDTALRILQAQESVGGILDPALGVFLPKDAAMDRDLINEELYQALNQYPKCYLDPDTQQATTYVSLKRKCKADPSTGLLLLPEPKKPITFQGLRGPVSVNDLMDANLLDRSDLDRLREGRLTSRDIEDRLHSYLRGSTCIAGIYDKASDKVMPIYQAMKDGLLRPGTTLELLEAQAASGFIVDPVNNHYLTVSDAYNKRLFGPEFKDNLLSAERAVTGYKLPGTDKTISLFQAIERGLVEKGHGIRLLEAQIASGGIIDPEHSHRIDVNVAYKRGYFDKEMNKILTDQTADTKGFFDPNTEENLTYMELKKRCTTDEKTGLILLPIIDTKNEESTQTNTRRKRRVVIVDPATNKEMTVREAYDKGYIDYDTFLELSEQECEWEEVTITNPDGSTQFLLNDKKTGRQYDITELIETGVIDQSDVDRYRSRTITLTQFADIICNKTKHGSSSFSTSSSTSRTSASRGTSSVTSSSSSSTSRTSASLGSLSETSSSTFRTTAASVPLSVTSSSSSSSSVLPRPLSPTFSNMTLTKTTTVTERSTSVSGVARDTLDSARGVSSVSITLSSPAETVGDLEPVGAIFDTDNMEKISITEALNRGLVDSITAQRLLEAQACTGGIINPTNGQRLSIQEASRQGIISDDMALKLKPAQKAYFGFEDVKNRKKMSAAQAMKEMWLPYEAGQRFLEFQFVTGGVYDPEMECRKTLEDTVKMGWLDERAATKLQDTRHHTKNLTCPKTKLKISYKEALDNCLVEESNGVKMLQASAESSRGISSPYNASSTPGSASGSRSGSRQGSRRSSVDLGSPTSSSTSRTSFRHTSYSFSSTSAK